MKKKLALVLVCLMAMFAMACGSKKDPAAETIKPSATIAPAESTAAAESTPAVGGGAPIGLNEVEAVFHPSTSSATGAYATIKISETVKMDDESAWLGLCPEGKDYITELEADDVDVIWFNAEPREESDPYVFACDFSSVEDGNYALVVATSDDEEVGYVVIQLAMSKNGEEVKFDFENAKLKERPAK